MILLHTQYITAAAKRHHIKIQNQVQNDGQTEHEAEMKCGGEYSGRILHCQEISEKRDGVVSLLYY